MAYDYVLFPGRHHLLTLPGRLPRAEGSQSASPTRRASTPTAAARRSSSRSLAPTTARPAATRSPAHRREAQIERYAALAAMDCLVFPVDDVPQTERFAEYVLAAIAVQEGRS